MFLNDYNKEYNVFLQFQAQGQKYC